MKKRKDAVEKKLVSWNVNGLRACMGKGFAEFFKKADADVLCLQETKLSQGQLDFAPEGYHVFWNYAQKKGYSGTALFSKEMPLAVTCGISVAEHDTEGRVITAEFRDYYVVTVYTPNAQRELTRLAYRMEWEDAFRGYLGGLRSKKPVIVCGDMNVAHQEADLKNPKPNRGNAGFTDEERGKMTELLDSGFLDTFRYFYPDAKDRYSWWSYMFHARERNVGWRIDYFLASKELEGSLVSADILDAVTGSDHCPVELLVATPH
ncbi:MAG: exodeoxyribonuclease III [Lachnospiraceae bacterium]|nr:exodeoxyribonuclease III [Lachnospiraceae bacterium]